MSSYINAVSVLLVCFVLFIANSAVSGAYTKVCGGHYQRPPTGICGSQLSAIVYGLCGGRVYSPSAGQFNKRMCQTIVLERVGSVRRSDHKSNYITISNLPIKSSKIDVNGNGKVHIWFSYTMI